MRIQKKKADLALQKTIFPWKNELHVHQPDLTLTFHHFTFKDSLLSAVVVLDYWMNVIPGMTGLGIMGSK